MRKTCVSAVLLAVFPYGALLFLGAPSRETLWKNAREAADKGQPKTAMAHLDPIIEGALRDGAHAEAINAIGWKIALEGAIEGGKPEETITRMQREIARAPEAMRPVMSAILAHWHWQYYRQNSWRFVQRTATAAPPGDDFTTWDLPRLFAEIDAHFSRALAAADALKEIPIDRYDDLLVKGAMSDAYRPTLYDFLAHEALSFYTTPEQAGARPQDAFDLKAEDPILAPDKAFREWTADTPDTGSPVVKAIALYQDLLAFHAGTERKSAYAHVDLSRLVFGYNHASGEEKNARYKAALRRFADTWAAHEISAQARHHLASVLRGEDALQEAHAVATQGANSFPDSAGGRLCHNLVMEIEAPSYRVATERVWSEPWPVISVRYRNLGEVHFRIVRQDWRARLASGSYHPDHLDRDARKALLLESPAVAWSSELPPAGDYKERVEDIPAPRDIAPGFYFLIASARKDFGEADNVVICTPFWVSRLALVMRTAVDAFPLEGLILDAQTGEPQEGAEVSVYSHDRTGYTQAETVKTDARGLFHVAGPYPRGAFLLARHAGHEIATASSYAVAKPPRRPGDFTHTVFFTDRALYRPGQTINYKGIACRVDQDQDRYTAMPGANVTVAFLDVNGKEVATQRHRTGDYGSFSGSFTAPRDRLMGRMRIEVRSGPSGSVHFNVEEYKRPKFQVTMDAPAAGVKLNDTVTLSGTATAYTGAAVGGAQVRWRAARQVRYPAWWGWRYWWRTPVEDSQEIAHGRTVTAPDGTFSVTFTARPDLSVPEQEEPAFRFTVNADVTDTAGETRSAQRTVTAGYTALAASLDAAPWQTGSRPVEVTVATRTLDGEGQPAEGVLEIYRLKQPDAVVRPLLQGGRYHPFPATPPPDQSNPASWPLGELAAREGVVTNAQGHAAITATLAAGPYRAILRTQDRFGKPVTAYLGLQVLEPERDRLGTRVPDLLAAPSWEVQPGETFTALWGSGYTRARAFIEVIHRGATLQQYWTAPERTQVMITQKVTEAMRGGFTLRVTMVRENRAYLHTRHVAVPWSNKELAIKWERFVSRLEPGAKETWTAVVSGPGAERAVAEMCAALYDASLDAYAPHGWPREFNVFRRESAQQRSVFENQECRFHHLQGGWHRRSKAVNLQYRAFPGEIISPWPTWLARRGMRRGGMLGAPGGMDRAGGGMPPPAAMASGAEGVDDALSIQGEADLSSGDPQGDAEDGAPPSPDLAQVAARANLNETAFFFPRLLSDEAGVVRIEFTMPEDLTEWRFLGFAHDRELRSGYLESRAITAKDLMVQPNAPRFLREGDVLEFTVKVTNQSDAPQRGMVRLTLADAHTGANADAALGNTTTDLPFDIPARESRTCAWRLRVPDGAAFLTYKAVGSTGTLSDGEEGFLPVLSRRILVTESLPLPIRGPRTKDFAFTRLKASGASDSLRHKTLTLEMVSNPAWYAVMALPYLMEPPHESCEQTFNRLYANALARHIAASDSRIERVFSQWRATPALDSPLLKNQDLKAVMLEETPWFRQAMAESEARRNVGILFDANRLAAELVQTLRKLSEAQYEDGAWPWFPGGRENDYITLYITTGFGRLRRLGVTVDMAPALKALGRLDAWIARRYRGILERRTEDANHLSPTVALYLYCRSFFLKDRAIEAQHKAAVDYFLAQGAKHWLQVGSRQSQAHLAVALARFGDEKTPPDIMRSLAEYAVRGEETGMFWRDAERSWWWHRAPIETQAMMIEAFDEVAGDAQAVEDCKAWLLVQKQTQDWKTTKATADAVYALLLRGDSQLVSTAQVEVSLGGRALAPERVEAGTGYWQKRFVGPEIMPALGDVVLKKVDKGLAWGSLHWQYLEDMRHVTAYRGTPLTLVKRLFTREYTAAGPVLKAVDGPLAVGDELVVRIELRVDRDMEYVHMKDQRGSGTEPVNVLSRYRYQDGLGYYESTRDTASHFFIDFLPRGTYVFEYATRVVHRGIYQSGIAQIQCMYAPEFNSHSESFALEVR